MLTASKSGNVFGLARISLLACIRVPLVDAA
jgi:hypothetical protein